MHSRDRSSSGEERNDSKIRVCSSVGRAFICFARVFGADFSDVSGVAPIVQDKGMRRMKDRINVVTSVASSSCGSAS